MFYRNIVCIAIILIRYSSCYSSNNDGKSVHNSSIENIANISSSSDQRRLRWVNWQHKNVNDDNGIDELASFKDPFPQNSESSSASKTVGEESTFTTFEIHSDSAEDEALKLFAETEGKVPFTWWNQEAISWLPKETRGVKDDFAFGILTSVSTDVRLNMIKYWWIEGLNGCVMYIDSTEVNKAMISKLKLPSGLIPCSIPSDELSHEEALWMKKSPKRARVSLASIVLLKKFPHASWYVIGDDDTLFSPLALAQWLSNFDELDQWYIGGRSENMHIRKQFGWDRPSGGYVLSKGTMKSQITNLLPSCLEQASLALDKAFKISKESTSSSSSDFGTSINFGSWLLHRCLGRLGLPLTSNGGFHSMDDRDMQVLRDLVERHPVAPFLSLGHATKFLFSTRGSTDQIHYSNVLSSRLPLWFNKIKGGLITFTRALWHDPISFAQLTLAEVRADHASFTAAVSTGLSVRIWMGEAHQLLWHAQTKAENVIYSSVMKESGMFGPEEMIGDYEFCPLHQQIASKGSWVNKLHISLYVPRGTISDIPGGDPQQATKSQENRRKLDQTFDQVSTSSEDSNFSFQNDTNVRINTSVLQKDHKRRRLAAPTIRGGKRTPSPAVHKPGGGGGGLRNKNNGGGGNTMVNKIVNQQKMPYAMVMVLEARRPGRWQGSPHKMCHSSTHEVAYKERPDRRKLETLSPNMKNEPSHPALRNQSSNFVILKTIEDFLDEEDEYYNTYFSSQDIGFLESVQSSNTSRYQSLRTNGRKLNTIPPPPPLPPKQLLEVSSPQVETLSSLSPRTRVILMLGFDECSLTTSHEKYRSDFPFPNKETLGALISEAGGYNIGGEVLHRELSFNHFPFLKTHQELVDDKLKESVSKNAAKADSTSSEGTSSETHISSINSKPLVDSKQQPSGRRLNNNCKWIAWKKELVCENEPLAQPQQVQSQGNKGGNIKWQPKAKPKEFLAQQSLGNVKEYLNEENRCIVEDIAFGIISSATLSNSRLPFLKLWWIPGAVGCLSIEGKGLTGQFPFSAQPLLPAGLEVCTTPEDLQSKPWYSEDKHGSHRGALMPIILLRKFPSKSWYVIGDDDTLFSPLALAQWLSNFDFNDPWYLGGRSEDISQRGHLGFDMAFGGGGLVLSKGVLGMPGYVDALGVCYEQIQWQSVPGGDWVLHRCISRLGIPLTASPGMHQFDLTEHSWYYTSSMLDLFERHPIAPFISVHHPSRVFGVHLIKNNNIEDNKQSNFKRQQEQTSKFQVGEIGKNTVVGTIGEGKEILVAQDTFFEAMHHDPVAFLQHILCEVPTVSKQVHHVAPKGFALIIATGFSIRLWQNEISSLEKEVTPISSTYTTPSSNKETIGSKNKDSKSDLSDILHPSMNEYIWDQARVDVLAPPIENVNVYGRNTFYARYLFKAHQESFIGKMDSIKDRVTVSIYEPEKGPSSSPSFKQPHSSTESHEPYSYIIVSEERQMHRWVGAPVRFCHVGSYELEVSLKLAPVAGNLGEPELVLMLATRDCSISHKQPVLLPSLDEVTSLMQALKYPKPSSQQQPPPHKQPLKNQAASASQSQTQGFIPTVSVTTRSLNVPTLAFLH